MSMGTGKDRLGRVVVLTERACRHIVRGHPALDGHELAILRAVEVAEVSLPGNMLDREVHWAPRLGPAKGLAVVVSYATVPAIVVTAYPSSKPPRSDRKRQ